MVLVQLHACELEGMERYAASLQMSVVQFIRFALELPPLEAVLERERRRELGRAFPTVRSSSSLRLSRGQ
jgi:hypothetical protein